MRSSTNVAGLAAAASLLASSAVAQLLSKPFLTEPDLRSASVWWGQAADMEADLPAHSFRSEDWDKNYIPEAFLFLYYQNPAFNYSVWDVETKNVWFSDCAHANAVSRHVGSSKSWDEIFRIYSKTPVGVRQYMSNLLVIPDDALNSGTGAYAPGAATVVPSQYLNQPIILHEGFHNMDVAALPHPGLERYSLSRNWSDQYDKDSHVMTSYGQTNQIENFAETGHWSIADITRGLSTYTSKRGQVVNQLTHIRSVLERVVFPPSGTCTGKVFSVAAVDKRTSKRLRVPEGARLPDSLVWASKDRAGTEGLPIIDLPADLNWEPTHPDPIPAKEAPTVRRRRD